MDSFLTVGPPQLFAPWRCAALAGRDHSPSIAHSKAGRFPVKAPNRETWTTCAHVDIEKLDLNDKKPTL
jgi:hypothetical protein